MLPSMKIIVAGGTGFLGRHVVNALISKGHRLLLLARQPKEPVNKEAESISCNVAAGPLPIDEIRGSGAIVNLVGIKREDKRQTFEDAHIHVVENLIRAAKELAIGRFIHISVVCSRPDPKSAYHDTKWRAEELIRQSGLGFTILKPGVIYGRGDDLVRHLVKMIRSAPIFPVVGSGDTILQPVDVRDVAFAVASCLETKHSIEKTYEIVGPKRMTLREVVKTVAKGLQRKVLILPTPIWVQRIAVRIMNALSNDPLSTPAQLQMLIDGLYGDPEPARQDLGLNPRSFTPESVGEIVSSEIF